MNSLFASSRRYCDGKTQDACQQVRDVQRQVSPVFSANSRRDLAQGVIELPNLAGMGWGLLKDVPFEGLSPPPEVPNLEPKIQGFMPTDKQSYGQRCKK